MLEERTELQGELLQIKDHEEQQQLLQQKTPQLVKLITISQNTFILILQEFH